MSKTVNLAFKVPEDIHKKLKIISTLSEKSMTQVIIDFVRRQKVVIPEFAEEKTKTMKPAKRKDINPDYDEEVVRVAILKCKQDGLSLQQTADQLNSDSVPTAKSKPWQKGTVDGFVRKWREQEDQEALDTPID